MKELYAEIAFFRISLNKHFTTTTKSKIKSEIGIEKQLEKAKKKKKYLIILNSVFDVYLYFTHCCNHFIARAPSN